MSTKSLSSRYIETNFIPSILKPTPGSFRPDQLPGIRCDPCYPSDVTSYRDLYWAAFALRLQCVAGEHRFGWTEMGATRSIGVFVWAPDSAMDKLVAKDGPRVLQAMAGMGNMSIS